MDGEPESVQICPTHRPALLWTDERLGLSKELLDFDFVAMERPSELDVCEVTFSDRVNCDGRESAFLPTLGAAEDGSEASNGALVAIRGARTPLDCLLAVVLQEMMPGERSRVRIVTRAAVTIQLTVALSAIRPQAKRYLFQLSPGEMADWAAEQKDAGVALFKREAVSFAHAAFARAAKGLISLKPFEKLTDVEPQRVRQLFGMVCQNLAACLLKQRRYEDALYVLLDVTDAPDAAERAIYRRAVAHFHLRQLDEARAQIERLNYAQNREQRTLHEDIVREQSEYRSEYSNMVRKMFQ